MESRKTMCINSRYVNSRLMKRWRLLFITIFVMGLVPSHSYAHPSPNSLVFLDISPGGVAMEIQLPVPELELAFGNEISKNPETVIEKLGPQLKEYLKAHIHAFVTRGTPWMVEVVEMKMDKGKYIGSDIPYWEVIAHIILKPQPGEDTRKFMLDYDVIMHQVINHVALVSIRSDWETGSIHSNSAEASVIQWNTKDNVIYPLQVNLKKGSWWKGFKKMLELGMHHIKKGTDHLLFLVVLLLPAMLLINRKPASPAGRQWGKFGGTKYSLVKLLKIITAFTIGHSITLLIGALGWLKLPTQPVEILISVSILVSAIHAVYPLFPGKETYVAAGFGLIHGLAFATILSNLKLDAGTLALSILGFNLGIEMMQLFILAITIPWLFLLSKTPFYKWIRMAGAVMAAVSALAWTVERISGNANIITGFITDTSGYALLSIIALAIVSVAAYGWHYYQMKKKTFRVIKGQGSH